MQEPCRISVFVGSFPEQRLVFAHLLDAWDAVDIGEVEVICRQDPAKRLAHAFAPDRARKIEDALGLDDTVVLVFEAGWAGEAPLETERLRALGTFEGHRHRP